MKKKGKIELNADIIDFKKRLEEAERVATNISDRMPPVENWLWNLEVNTQFLCRPRTAEVSDDLEFHIVAKRFFPETGRYSVQLLSMLNKELHFWKNPIRFVNQFDLVGILDEPSDNIHPEGLEDSEQSEGVD